MSHDQQRRSENEFTQEYKELIRLPFNGGFLTLGEATAKAKAFVADQDIRRTWILFGDPATRLKDCVLFPQDVKASTSQIFLGIYLQKI